MATSDLFRETIKVKLFGVIPLYEKTIQQSSHDATTEEVSSVSIPQQSSSSPATEDRGTIINDFWSSL